MPAAATLHEPSAQLRFEDTLAEVFSELADLFGNPRSHGQIYGILFASPSPLTMDDIAARLEISKGSASQGLRALETLGAVERHATSRTATSAAKLELKLLITGFVRQRLLPRLTASKTLLATLPPLLAALPPGHEADYTLRLKRVTQWHDRALQCLPLAQKLLDTASKLPGSSGS
ncbi:MAG: GbsR/MarR family transcriptional regulator [Terrimicrobiaceae bacterium]